MTAPTLIPANRTIVYVDGFNLYYGAVAQTPYRWLDLQRLSRLLRPHEAIQKVWYFTALIDGGTRANQDVYLEALSTLPLVGVVMGNFKKKTIECRNPECPSLARKFFQTYEEKRTDVNIALQMLDDAYRNMCDRLVLISGDSDLVPAIEMIASRFPTKAVNVYIPVPANSQKGSRERSYKKELRSAATTVRTLPGQLLPLAQLPNPIILPNGITLQKPPDWLGPKGSRPSRIQPPMLTGRCSWCGKL